MLQLRSMQCRTQTASLRPFSLQVNSTVKAQQLYKILKRGKKSGGEFLPKQRNASPLSPYKDETPGFPSERKYFYFFQL